MASSSICKVNNLILAKAIFFSNSLSSVGWNRFQNNFYLENGMTSYEIGSLKSFGLILKVIGEPFWSFVADVTDPKAVFVLSMLVQIFSMEMLRRAHPLTYNIVLSVKILRTLTSLSGTLTSTASFKLTDGSNEGYGQQRMFGSLAWGLGAFLSGFLIDAFGMDALFFFTYMFILSNFVLVMVGYPSKKSDQSNSKFPLRPRASIFDLLQTGVTQYYSEMKQFFGSAPCRAVLINAFGYGAVMTVIDTFLYISLEKDFHASRSYSGCCTAASILSCLPIFWYSDYLISTYGHFNMILVAQLTCVWRLIAYAVLPVSSVQSLHIIFAIQVFHGMCFALYWAAAIDAIYKLSPKNLTSSCLAMLNVMYFTLSGALGNWFWGWLYSFTDEIKWVYILSASACILLVLNFRSCEGVLKVGLTTATSAVGTVGFSKSLSHGSLSDKI